MADYYKGSPFQDVRDYSGKKKKKKGKVFKGLTGDQLKLDIFGQDNDGPV